MRWRRMRPKKPSRYPDAATRAMVFSPHRLPADTHPGIKQRFIELATASVGYYQHLYGD
jgi:hypothetical protein